MVGNITFLMIFAVFDVAVNTVDKLQFFVLILLDASPLELALELLSRACAGALIILTTHRCLRRSHNHASLRCTLVIILLCVCVRCVSAKRVSVDHVLR